MIEVKTRPLYFQQVWTQIKLSELRFDDDKDYRIGSTLVQRECRTDGKYTGRWVSAKISAITRVSHWIEGVDDRWVILHLDVETWQRGSDYDKDTDLIRNGVGWGFSSGGGACWTD